MSVDFMGRLHDPGYRNGPGYRIALIAAALIGIIAILDLFGCIRAAGS